MDREKEENYQDKKTPCLQRMASVLLVGVFGVYSGR